jgi:hypothetical protein
VLQDHILPSVSGLRTLAGPNPVCGNQFGCIEQFLHFPLQV